MWRADERPPGLIYGTAPETHEVTDTGLKHTLS